MAPWRGRLGAPTGRTGPASGRHSGPQGRGGEDPNRRDGSRLRTYPPTDEMAYSRRRRGFLLVGLDTTTPRVAGRSLPSAFTERRHVARTVTNGVCHSQVRIPPNAEIPAGTAPPRNGESFPPPAFGGLCRPEAGVPSRPRASTQSAIRSSARLWRAVPAGGRPSSPGGGDKPSPPSCRGELSPSCDREYEKSVLVVLASSIPMILGKVAQPHVWLQDAKNPFVSGGVVSGQSRVRVVYGCRRGQITLLQPRVVVGLSGIAAGEDGAVDDRHKPGSAFASSPFCPSSTFDGSEGKKVE